MNVWIPLPMRPDRIDISRDLTMLVSPGTDSDATVITLHGELDLSNSTALADGLTFALAEAATNGRPEVHIDAADLSFTDSRGVDALADVARTRAAGGTIRVTNAPRSLRIIVSILGLDEVLHIS